MTFLSSLKRTGVEILTSSLVIKIVKFFYGKSMPFLGLKIDVSNPLISDREIIHLFWGIYEKAEIRLAGKYYVKSMPIVELGSSIGVVSAILGRIKDPSTPMFCIEANELLIPSLEKNLVINKIENYNILQKAIGPVESSTVNFTLASSSLNSKISGDSLGKEVETLNLADFVRKEALEHFFLICDIEGAEIFIVQEQLEFLQNCKIAVIELHNISYKGKYYSRESINELILLKTNMKLADQFRHVFVYRRT